MTTPTKVPTGVQLTPFDQAFREDPYRVLSRLREAERVHRDETLNRWFLTSHDHVREVLRDKSLWSDPRKSNPGSFTRMFLRSEDEEPSMLMMDDPDHMRLRGLVSRSFTPKAVETWRPRVRDVVERVLDDIEGDEFDLIRDFAGPIPTVVIAEMLGIDATMHSQFKSWSDISVAVSFNPFADADAQAEADSARLALNAFFRGEIDKRRVEAADDLISDMVRAEEAGERLTDQEIVQQCNLLLIAGNVTTTDLIGNGVKALLEHPAQLAALRAEPSLIENAIEEMLRFDSPVINSGRIASSEMMLDGCPIHRGESITVSLGAANRDPAVYEEPDVFDIRREDTHHHAFGGGRHHCLGAPLARLEAQEAILGLLARYPHITMADGGCEYHTIPSFRGLKRFRVETGPSR